LHIKEADAEADHVTTCTDVTPDTNGTVVCTTADIANCDQLLCQENVSTRNRQRNRNLATVYVKGCRTCKAGFEFGGTKIEATLDTVIKAIGYTTCVTMAAVANCNEGIFHDKANCYVCKSEFAVASANDTSCETFTADANCRKLSSTWCKECKMSYFFNSQMCTLKAGLIGFSMLALLALFNY